MCFSCGFLVSVLWMVFVPPFVLLLDSLSPFRFSPRSSFRSSVRFARFVPRHVFRLAVRFVCFVWACRRGGVVRRCLGRGGWLIVWRGEMAGRLPCAPFLSARVRGRWRWFLVFRSPRLASRLFCSFRRGGRCVSCLASVGRGRMRLRCGVVSFSRPVWASRAVSSAFRRCRRSIRTRSVGRVVWRRVWRRVVGAWRYGGAWLLDVGGAMFVVR